MDVRARASTGWLERRRAASSSWRLSRLELARALWLVVAALALAFALVSIPVYYHQLRTLQAVPTNAPGFDAAGLGRTLAAIGWSAQAYAAFKIVAMTGLIAGFFVTATLIYWQQRNDWVALLAAFGFVSFGVTFPPTARSLVDRPLWSVVDHGLSIIGFATFFLLFFLFPDGRFVPRWTRYLAAIWVLKEVLGGLGPPPSPVFATADLLLTFGLLITMVAAQVYRYRAVSTALERQQMKWVVGGITLAVAGFVGYFALPGVFPVLSQPGRAGLWFDLTGGPLLVCALLGLPCSLTVAMLRFHLWDIDLIVNRALVYASLTASLGLCYLLLISGLTLVLQVHNGLLISLVGAGLLAVLVQPLRQRLQQAINRLMYGERDDPYRVISRLSRRLEGNLAPAAALSTIVETIGQALRLPYVAVALLQDDRFTLVAESGQRAPAALTLPLLHGGEVVGELRLAARRGQEQFGMSDRQLVEELARQTGGAVHALLLSTELQRSRERLVTAREEERRRLRRDLHDGLGPALASLTLRIDAARNLIRRDPEAADAVLLDLKRQTQGAIADIRQLVYALRPPTLDDLGLISALREQARQYEAGGLRVVIQAPATLPALPAAVEVVVFRVAQEALTNVVRHAQAQSCRVVLKLDSDELTLEVSDDGRGLVPGGKAGVGLLSMRERAEELGGRCEVEPAVPRGTRVRLSLPLARNLLDQLESER